MNLEKTAKFAGDFRTIYFALAVMIAGAAWAGDTRWMTVADAEKIPIQIKLDALSEAVEEMTLEKRFETDPEKLKKLNAYIEYKKEKMEALIKKYKLSL